MGTSARAWWQGAAWALLVAWLAFGSRARADDPVALEALHDEIDLAEHVSLLRDPEGTLTLPDVRANYDAFVPHDGSPLSFGLDFDALWLRFSVANQSAQPVRWLLEVAEPTLEHLTLYVVHRDGHSETYQGGTALPFTSRSTRHANFVFGFESAPEDEAVYYLRVRSHYVLRAPLRVWSPVAYDAHHESDMLLRSLSIGALLLVALYHFGVFALVRQVESLWYALVALSLCGVTMALNGQLAQFLLPDQPGLVMRGPPLTIALGMITVAFFTYEATVQLKTEPALARLLLKVAYSTLALLPLVGLAPTGVTLRVELTILLGLTLCGPYILYVVRRFQIPEMGLYTFGWYTLILSLPVAILRYAGVLPDVAVTEWTLPIGFVAYGVANSLALAALARRLRAELFTMNERLVDNVEGLQQALVRAEEANEAARRATKSKDEFVATMSHELRTPLNAIINIPQGLIGEFERVRSARCSHCQASYLLDDGDEIDADTCCEDCQQLGTLVEGVKIKYRGDEARCLRFLQKIERSGQHLLQMVNGVLDYSKLEAGRFELVLGAVDLDALIREVSDEMSVIAQNKEIRLAVCSPPQVDVALMADVLRLKQVLINLLANAIKFSEPASTVTVRWATAAEMVQIDVEDHGIGIAPSDHERVFTSFEQVHNGDTRKYGGTGLGLSISRSLVRMHGGELSVKSELGHGATFIVRLPRIAGQADSNQSAPQAQPNNTNGDDVYAIQARARAALEQSS